MDGGRGTEEVNGEGSGGKLWTAGGRHGKWRASSWMLGAALIVDGAQNHVPLPHPVLRMERHYLRQHFPCLFGSQ